MRLDLRLGTIPELRDLTGRERSRLWRKVALREMRTWRFAWRLGVALLGMTVSMRYLLDSFGSAKGDDSYWIVRTIVLAITYWIGSAWIWNPVWPKLIEEANNDKKARITSGSTEGETRGRRPRAQPDAIALGLPQPGRP